MSNLKSNDTKSKKTRIAGFRNDLAELKQVANKKQDKCKKDNPMTLKSPGLDPRFQQQNQTHRCYVMYLDFHQCEHLLGEGKEECQWFQDVYKRICPNSWIEQWDDWKERKIMPWYRHAEFPKGEYGKK